MRKGEIKPEKICQVVKDQNVIVEEWRLFIHNIVSCKYNTLKNLKVRWSTVANFLNTFRTF